MAMPGVSLCPNCRAMVSLFDCFCGYKKVKELITIEMYRGNIPLSQELEANAKELLLKVNSLLQELGITKAFMTSGYRDPAHNKAIGGAEKSKHTLAKAIDLADNDREIGNRIMTNLQKLKDRDMAIENLMYCERLNGNKWVHIQCGLPPSGKVVFVPYAGIPKLK